jgi:hypothetical protein
MQVVDQDPREFFIWVEKAAETLHHAALFSNHHPETLDADADPEAVMFFLQGLAALEMARRSFGLARLAQTKANAKGSK